MSAKKNYWLVLRQAEFIWEEVHRSIKTTVWIWKRIIISTAAIWSSSSTNLRTSTKADVKNVSDQTANWMNPSKWLSQTLNSICGGIPSSYLIVLSTAITPKNEEKFSG